MKRAPFFIPRSGRMEVPEIDDEHKEIVEALDQVRQHIDEGQEANLAKTREVGNSLVSHFRSEERLMQDYHYLHLPQHIIHHDQSLGMIYRILGNCENLGRVEIEDLRSLYRVLIDDIFSADMHFSAYLLDIGAAGRGA